MKVQRKKSYSHFKSLSLMHFVTSADRAGHLVICVGKDSPFFSDF